MVFLNNKISIRQLQVLLILDIFGTSVIVLPRRACIVAGQDGYISVLVATAVAIVLTYLITTAGGLFPGESFFGYTSKLLSKPVGFVLSIGFAAKLILNAALELRMFVEIMRQTLLYHTPFWVVSLIMLLMAGYGASKGYEARGRLAELFIYIVLAPLAIVFIVAIFGADISNLKPVLATPPDKLLAGATITLAAFTGLELLLLVFPYLSDPAAARKGAMSAITFVGAVMTVITCITIATFGPSEIKSQLWPVLEMMDVTQLTGTFMERQEALIISFFIITVFFVINAGLFFSSLLIKDTLKRGTHSLYIIICAAAAFGLSLVPATMEQIYRLMDAVFMTAGLFYMGAVPFVVIIFGRLRKSKAGGATRAENI